jgi:hypothetical protein
MEGEGQKGSDDVRVYESWGQKRAQEGQKEENATGRAG